MAARKRPAKPRRRPKAPARVKKRRRTRAGGGGHQHPELVGLGIAAAGAFLATVMYAGWNGGYVGKAVADGLVSLVGGLAYALPIAALTVGALMVGRSALPSVRPFRTGAVVAAVGVILVLGRAHGGIAGHAADAVLGRVIGTVGIRILGVLALVAGTILITGASLGAILRSSGSMIRRAHANRPRRRARPAPVAASPARVTVEPAAAPFDGAATDFPDVVGEPAAEGPPPLLLLPAPRAEAGRDPRAAADAASEPDGETSILPVLREDGGEGERPYSLPDRRLLRRSQPAAKASADATAKVAELLVHTLANFGVEATVVGEISGPRVTRYELQLAPGTKVAKVAALKDDLSYALATTEIRILAPIPGKQAVGVEVPNASPAIVTLGDIYDTLPATASPLSVWLGKDISGNAVWADLARMPHLLIAGTTGAGKSGCINTMLTSILLGATPDEVRMILIDPKRVELNFYESIPHLLTPVVSNPKGAAAVLDNVVNEMEKRYDRMSFFRARTITELNRALRQRGEVPLPYLLVVIDELADLMMVSPQAVEDSIIRLAQKSRAVGIHLVLATQRPSVDVITGMIKANVPSRIAFAVSSQTDSRVILDQSGAESLLGQGDMLFKPLGTSRLQRIQGAYVGEEEVALIVDQCRTQAEQELDEEFLLGPTVVEGEGEDGEDGFDPDEDPLLERAIEVVVQAQTASVSLLQRRLRVGYTRAGRLIDMLERRGIISPYEGSKPRRVLVGEGDLPQVLEPTT
jgi:S-DNA-T family DNA segregation ATPase FtsK/SpoIIIE